MHDDELEYQRSRIIEDAIGPFVSFEAPEALAAAVDSSFPGLTGIGEIANRLWERVHWFRLHASHGPPELIRIWPERWREGHPFGLQMVFECPCAGTYGPGGPFGPGDRILTYEALVPEPYRRMSPREPW